MVHDWRAHLDRLVRLQIISTLANGDATGSPLAASVLHQSRRQTREPRGGHLDKHAGGLAHARCWRELQFRCSMVMSLWAKSDRIVPHEMARQPDLPTMSTITAITVAIEPPGTVRRNPTKRSYPAVTAAVLLK